MRLKQYINELAMKKGTIITNPKYKKESMYEQDIILEDGLKFKFICYFFRTSDLWEIAFEDENEARHKDEKRQGASIELFAAIEKVFKKFIDTALPNEFHFSSDLEEKSRVKLYDLLSKKIVKMGYGYVMYERKKTSVAIIYKFKHRSSV
jgi:hypothetical protein